MSLSLGSPSRFVCAFLFFPFLVLLAALLRSGPALPIILLKITATAFLFLLSFFGWGHLITRRSGSEDPLVDDLMRKLVMGVAFVYAVSLALAFSGLYRPLPILILLISGSLVSVPAIIPTLRQISARLQEFQRWERADQILLFAVSGLAGVQIVFGWTPLSNYDLMVYHFFAPAQFQLDGTLSFLPWNVYTNSPMAMQLTLGTSLVLDRSGAASKLVISLIGCSLAAGAGSFIRDTNKRSMLLAALFVLVYPAFWIPQTLGMIDFAMAGFAIFGALWFRKLLKEPGWRFFLPSCCALGMPVASRYQGIVGVFVIVVVVFLENRFRKNMPGVWKKTLALCSLLFLMLLPWLIRNQIHQGNPIFPLQFERWGGTDWSVTQQSMLNDEVLGPSFSRISDSQKILAPLTLLLMAPGNGLFGPVLFLAGILALADSKRRSVWLAAAIGFAGLLPWAVIHPLPDVNLVRFNAASLVFLLATTAAVLGNPELFAKRGTWAGGILAGGSLVISIFLLIEAFPVASSVTDLAVRKDSQEANVPGMKAFEQANSKLDPERDRVLLIGETRGFWLEVPCISPSVFNGPQVEKLFLPDSRPDLWPGNFRNMRITHVIFCLPELQRLRNRGYLNLLPDRIRNIQQWIQSQTPIFNDQQGTLLVEITR
jgi:hypothetical protein